MRSHAKAVVAVSAVLLLTLALAANPASAEAPTVSIDPPSEVAYTTAKASGTVDPKDIGAWWSYETSTDGGATWSGFGYHGYAEANTGSQPTPFELTGLQPGTEYELRLVANNFTDPEVVSAVESFETLPVAKPTVTLDPVSDIGGEQASFEGEVNPNAPDSNENLSDAAKAAFATTYRFECTPACPNTPGPQVIAADDEPTPVSFDPENLEPDTPYTVKLFASNAGGEEVAERSFETAAIGPAVAAGTVGALSHGSARLTAYVDANNAATTVTFEYDEDAGFSSPSTAPSGDGTTISGNGNKVAFADVGGLSPETTYYWRVSAESAEGADLADAPAGFETWPTPPADQGGVGAFGARQVELVSEPDTVPVVSGALSADENRVLYSVYGGGDQSSEGANGHTLARRTADGWVYSNPLPSREILGGLAPMEPMDNAEFTRFVFKKQRAGVNSGGPSQVARYSPATQSLAEVYTFTSPSLTGLPTLVSSQDLEHIFGVMRSPLLPGDSGPGGRLYEFGAGQAQLVGLMPDGITPACASQEDWVSTTSGDQSQNYVSSDGERVFFTASGADCTEAKQIYMREGGVVDATTLVSGPPLEGEPGPAQFVKAAADGSWVIFTTATRLDPADANSFTDIYRYVNGEESECLTCLVADANPREHNGSAPAVAVSEDGTHVYFTSERALAPGARPGVQNLYVWRQGSSTIGFVAPSDGLEPIASNPTATTTPDGGVLIFASSRPELNALTGSENDGTSQYYRYDERARTLVCVSCPSAGSAAVAVRGLTRRSGSGGGLLPIEALARDGSALVFSTMSPLAPSDLNEGVDVYEWRDGSVGQVSAGRSVEGITEAAAFSPDASELLFVNVDALDPRAVGAAPALYAARLGDTFRPPQPPAPCSGDGCRGPIAAPPADATPGTASFGGPRNQIQRCPKGKVKKKSRCVKPPSKRKQRKAGGKRAHGKSRTAR